MKDEENRYNPWLAGLSCRPILILVGLIALLSGCAGSGGRDGPVGESESAAIPDAVPKAEPRSRYGNPDTYVVFGKRYRTKKSSTGHVERGLASWYGKKFHGRKTSSGERYDMYAMTAAHKTLPLPTYTKVTNLENGRSAVVKVNDRGPFHGDRVIDLSYSAARKLGVVAKGTARVEVRAIDPSRPRYDQQEENLFADAGSPAADQFPARREAAVVAQSTPSAVGKRRTPAATQTTLAAQPTVPVRPKRTASPEKPPLVAQTKKPAAKKPTALPVETQLRVASVSPEPKPVRTTTKARTTAASDSSLYLQVGAFGSRTNAEQLRRQLVAKLNEQVQVRTSDGGEAALYKVRVGPLDSRSRARNVSQQLASLGVIQSHVVSE